MTNQIRKSSFFFALIILFFSSFSLSQTVTEIKLKPASPQFKVAADEANKDILNITTLISVLRAKEAQTKSGNFVELETDGLMKIFGKGKPNLPVYSKLIEAPLDAKVEFRILSFDQEIINLNDHGINAKIIPAQPSLSKSDDPEQAPFYFDEAEYNKNEFVNTKITGYDDAGILRNTRLVRIEIRPIQYNPVQNKLKILNNLKIQIRFVGGNFQKTNELKINNSSALFDEILKKLVPNFEPAAQGGFKENLTYVIVSDRMFEATLAPLIAEKNSLGYNVIIGYTDEAAVGGTTSSIKNYLRNLYNNPPAGYQPPHFLLLVGDVSQIPAFNGTEGYHVSDLYYAEYTGDALPELFYGRFSANNTSQLQPQVDKTLEYEQNLMPDPSYIQNALLVAGADDYHSSTWGNGQVNYGTDVYFNSENDITAYAYLQPEPAGANYSQQIKGHINDGVGFANYSAHCSPDGWADPSFWSNDIQNLTNSHKYGLWVGNCCESNKFNELECFGEAALRANNKGALGYIGGSNSTFWDEDYWWAVGFKTVTAHPVYDAENLGAFDCLFHTHEEPETEHFSTQGQMVVAGNLAVQSSTSQDKVYYWEIYHLMGDPSLFMKFVPGGNEPQVTEHFPCVSSVEPAEASPGQSLDIDIYGANFTQSCEVAFWQGKHSGPINAPYGPDFEYVPAQITVNNITFIKTTHIRVNITIAETAETDGTHPLDHEYHFYMIKNCLRLDVPENGYDRFFFKIVE